MATAGDGAHLLGIRQPLKKTTTCAPTVRPSTLDEYERDLRAHLVPHIGFMPLAKLDGPALNRLWAHFGVSGRRPVELGAPSQGLSAKSVENVAMTVHRVLRDAARWGRISKSPAAMADPPKRSATHCPIKAWNVETLRTLLELTRDDVEWPLWIVLATTGLRRGEALGLRWSDVDLEFGRAHVVRTVTATGWQIHIGLPKPRLASGRSEPAGSWRASVKNYVCGADDVVVDVADVAELGVVVVDHVAELVVVLDQSGNIRYANRRAEVLLGLSRDDWIGRAAFDLIHPDDLPLALELLVSSQATGAGVKEPVQYRLRRADDTWLSVEIVACPFELDSGSAAIVITGREMSARRGPDAIVSEVAARLSRMFDDAACGMTQTSLAGELLRVNRSFATMLGYQPDELVGRSFSTLSHPEDRHNDIIRFRELCEGAVDMCRSSKRYLSRAGEIVHAELTASMVFDRWGQPLYCASQTIDVSELRALQAELTYRSTHDRLTGLANRTCFETLLDQALSRAARSDDPVGVLFVDLDGFKAVNDRFGHTVGDQVLARVADRLSGAVRNGDVVARFGGDEFVVMTENTSVAAAVGTAHRLVQEVSAPYCIDGMAVDLGVSVGVAVEPAGQVSAAALITHADAALYRAKRNGRGQIAVHGQPCTTQQAK